MTQLALLGGPRSADLGSLGKDLLAWPCVGDDERNEVMDVLNHGPFTSNDQGRGPVSHLEREWAEYVGVRHCIATSNGTSALELALAALDLPPGSQVLVPALTFIGTVAPVVARMLVPVFVDIDPVTYTMDAGKAAEAITDQTRALVVVHLHGLPADMQGLTALAEQHGLHVIEDAAQAQGATYHGQRVGGLGTINATSLNVVKNLPTCGEGGLITTNDDALWQEAVIRRQFGEDLSGRRRNYLSQRIAGNAKMSAVQAAFTRCQLARLDETTAQRNLNIGALMSSLADLPGLECPVTPDDRSHVYHILRFRIDPTAAGRPDLDPGQLRAVLERALQAEGAPVQPYQVLPLPGQPAFRNRAGYQGLPWNLPGGHQTAYDMQDFPESLATIDSTFTIQRIHLNPRSGPALQLVADAFVKVWSHLDQLADIARTTPHVPRWEAAAPRGRS